MQSSNYLGSSIGDRLGLLGSDEFDRDLGIGFADSGSSASEADPTCFDLSGKDPCEGLLLREQRRGRLRAQARRIESAHQKPYLRDAAPELLRHRKLDERGSPLHRVEGDVVREVETSYRDWSALENEIEFDAVLRDRVTAFNTTSDLAGAARDSRFVRSVLELDDWSLRRNLLEMCEFRGIDPGPRMAAACVAFLVFAETRFDQAVPYLLSYVGSVCERGLPDPPGDLAVYALSCICESDVPEPIGYRYRDEDRERVLQQAWEYARCHYLVSRSKIRSGAV